MDIHRAGGDGRSIPCNDCTAAPSSGQQHWGPATL